MEFLIKTKNDKIRNKAIYFLINIFFGIRLETKEKLQAFWNDFVSNIYIYIYIYKIRDIILKENNINENDNTNDINSKTKYSLSIQRIISLIKNRKEFSNNGEIIKDINQISKEIEYYKEQNIKNNIGEKNIKILIQDE